MTSLSEQLQRLAIPAAAQLTADRRRASFLFDAKHAAGLDRETVFKIGQQGLTGLKEIDAAFNEFDNSLFAESSQNVDRSILSKEANAKLNANIERFLLRMTPYFLLSPAHKALEWLVYRFNVHQFNVDALLALGLPYHDTNTFARLLNVVDFAPNDKQWAWLQPFKKADSPVTRRVLLNQCLSSNHALVSFICEQISRAIAILGEEESAAKVQVLFTFVASTLIGTLEDGSLVTDKLVSKVVPYLATGLRSSLKSYRLCCLMVTCQLAVVTTLSETVVQSLLKLILLKGNVATIEASLAASVVLCQRQTVKDLPRKAIVKLARKAADLSLVGHLTTLSETVELDRFLKPLWKTLLNRAIVVDDDTRQVCADLLASTISDLKLTSTQAIIFFRLFMETQTGGAEDNIPDVLKKAVRAACLRHAAAFDVVLTEWQVQDMSAVAAVIARCSIALHEIAMTDVDVETATEKKKRRRRNSSMRQSESENNNHEASLPKPPDHYKVMETTAKPVFQGDPFAAFQSAIASGDTEKAMLAVEHVTAANYLKKAPETQEDFVTAAIQLCLKKSTAIHVMSTIRSVLSELPIANELLCDLLSKKELGSPGKKKRRSVAPNPPPVGEEVDETDAQYWARLSLVLEAVHTNKTITASARLIALLFTIVNDALILEETDALGNYEYVAQLALSLLAKLVTNPGKVHIAKKDLNIDLIVKCIRTARSQRTLQESLRLLTGATKIAQDAVLAHVMSVFTFMGSGVFRKDDAFTFAIVHETLDALLSALVASPDVSTHGSKLIEVYRVFAASLQDIPDHRRLSVMVRVVQASEHKDAKTHPHLWLLIAVLLEHYCANWQRAESEKSKNVIQPTEEFALSVCAQFSAVDQLICAQELLRYIHSLGSDKAKDDEISTGLQPFDRSTHSVKKLRHFRFVVLGWVSSFLSQTDLIEKLAAMSTQDLSASVSGVGEKLFSVAMQLEQMFTDLADTQTVDADKKYWRAMAVRGDAVLKKLRSLLPVEVSLNLIAGLLRSDLIKVKQSAVDLLNTKLLQQPTPFTRAHIPLLADVAKILCRWLVVGSPNDAEELIALRQMAAYSLKLFARVIGKYDQACVSDAFDKCVTMIHAWKKLNQLLLGNVLLCAAELVACLETKAVVKVPTLMPAILAILDDDCIRQNELLLVSAVTCMQRIVEALSDFLTPYLKQMLVSVSRFSVKYVTSEGDVVDRTTQHGVIVHRLSQMSKRLASIDDRVLLRPLKDAHDALLNEGKPLTKLFTLFAAHIEAIEQKQLNEHLSAMTTLFFEMFTLRSRFSNESLTVVNALEESLIEAFAKLACRLSENTFRPLMFQLAEWVESGLRDQANVEERDRVIIGFRLCNKLADDLGPLFALFAGQFFAMIPDVLRRCNANKAEKKVRLFGVKGDDKHDYLIGLVFDLARKCTLHQRFLTKERFDSLVQPIADEVDNTKTGDYLSRIELRVAPCVNKLATTVNDDTAWKSLNTAVLLKTRSPRWKVRKGALIVVGALYAALGEAVAPLMPETVPFLSELFEDENENVEAECQKVVKALEKVLGEGMQQFF